MRVTDRQKYQGLIPRYQDLLARQLKLQGQIASGRRIQQVSDDPTGAARGQSLTQEINGLEQNQRNITAALAWVSTSEGALRESIDLVQRARELGIQAGDPILNESSRTGIVQELEQILRSLIGVTGQTQLGNSVFSGTATDQPAFSAVTDANGRIIEVVYNGNDEIRSTEIGPSSVTPFNILGSNEFGGDFGAFRDENLGVDIYQSIIDLRDNVLANDRSAIAGTSVKELQTAIDHLAVAMSRVGGIQSRMNNAELINEDVLELTARTLSQVQDTDIAAASVESNALNTSYQAALAVGARIMQNSLLDYLR